MIRVEVHFHQPQNGVSYEDVPVLMCSSPVKAHIGDKNNFRVGQRCTYVEGGKQCPYTYIIKTVRVPKNIPPSRAPRPGR